MAEPNADQAVSLYPYAPPTSIWSLIKYQLPSNELEEVRSLLGESLIEQSKDLHNEVEVLLDIWRECHREAQEQEAVLRHPRLPEPPEQRDRLKTEIKLFVQSIQEKAKEIGGDPGSILSLQKSEVLDYVFEKRNCDGKSKTANCVRPKSAISNGRETPLSREPLLTNRSGRESSMDDVLGQNKDVNLENLEKVTQHLRDALKEEIDFLLQDIEFLQECIDAEVNFKSSQTTHEPTLTDLREQRNHLERELLLLSDVPKVHRKSSIDYPHKQKLNRENTENPSTSFSSSELLTSVKPLHNSSLISHQMRTLNIDRPHRPADLPKEHPARPFRGTVAVPTGTETPSQFSTSFLQNSLPTHVTVRTGSRTLPPNTKLVKVGSIMAKNCLPSDGRVIPPMSVPVQSSNLPPTSRRPGSAQKFRKMVMECRESK